MAGIGARDTHTMAYDIDRAEENLPRARIAGSPALTSQAGIRGSKTSAYSLLFASRIRFTIGIEKFDTDRTSMGAVTT